MTRESDMKIYLIWEENTVDGNSEVIGFCQTEDAAYKMCNKFKAKLKNTRWNYWVEELEELI
jgi:hypothetical protein